MCDLSQFFVVILFHGDSSGLSSIASIRSLSSQHCQSSAFFTKPQELQDFEEVYDSSLDGWTLLLSKARSFSFLLQILCKRGHGAVLVTYFGAYSKFINVTSFQRGAAITRHCIVGCGHESLCKYTINNKQLHTKLPVTPVVTVTGTF